MCENNYVWNPATCNCENGKYLASIVDDSVIINFNKKNMTSVAQNFYILLFFLLITIALLITVSICCNLIKYRAKDLSPIHGMKD